VARLSQTLGLAHGTIYRRRSSPGAALVRFFTETFPAAVWHMRRAVLIAAVLLLAPAVATGLWLANDAAVRTVAIDRDLQRALASGEFEEYYRSDAAATFQTAVTVNNIRVSFLAFISGVFLGLPTMYILVINGANIGVAGAVMHAYDQSPLFWGLILPHGLLEITAVVVAGGAGLALGWSLVVPGDRTRGRAFSEAGLRAVAAVMGLTVCFVVAGFVEAWVTPSELPTWARVGIGVLVEALFILYIVGLGRAAADRGLTGRLGEVPPPDGATAPLQLRGVPST
jgi:uncharacterized membrane protein SpoIIM required for sporulation